MLNLDISGQIATLTINHPARRNAMTREMWRQLQGIGESLTPSVRCLVIRGEGDHFCSGGDISEYPSFRFDAKSLAHFHENEVAPALDALLGLDIPVIAMIAGHCMGGGMEIASCADIRIASESASFGAPIAKLGMPMAQREMQIVMRAAGEASVREMLLEARLLDAVEMKTRGFVQRLVSDDELELEVQQTAQRIASLSPMAARLNKATFRQLLEPNQWIEQAEPAQGAHHSIASDPILAAYAYAPHDDHVEGVSAFLEKRSPKF
jgi:enoyl-CoA hydratase/carnithine racemase